MPVRRIQEIVIVYTVPGDETPRELRIANAEGQVIDGLIWSRALVERLRYAAGEGCVPPKLQPGGKPWRVVKQPDRPAFDASSAATIEASTAETTTASTAEPQAAGTDCVWLHDEDCNWDWYCVE